MVPRGPARTSVLLLLKRECQYSEAPSSTWNNRLEHFVQTIPQPADLHSQPARAAAHTELPEKISSIIHGINQSLKAHTDRHPHTVCAAPKAPKFGLSILAARPASSTRATDASADAMGRSSGVTKLASTYTRPRERFQIKRTPTFARAAPRYCRRRRRRSSEACVGGLLSPSLYRARRLADATSFPPSDELGWSEQNQKKCLSIWWGRRDVQSIPTRGRGHSGGSVERGSCQAKKGHHHSMQQRRMRQFRHISARAVLG